MPITSTLSPASLNSAATCASASGIASRSSSPTLTTASTRRAVSRKCGASSSRWSAVRPARYSGRPSPRAAFAVRRASSSSPSERSSLDCRSTWARRFSTVSRSARASSSSTTRRCSRGSGEPDTSSSANARRTKTMASTSRMLARKRLPRPSPLLAPSTSPPMSTTCTAAWTTLRLLDISASRSRRSSGTLATPMFGSLVAKA